MSDVNIMFSVKVVRGLCLWLNMRRSCTEASALEMLEYRDISL